MALKNQSRAWILDALEEHELRLLRYALRLLGDEPSARDAVQHAFLKLCDTWSPGFSRPTPQSDRLKAGLQQEKLAPWLFAVVRNRATDLLRERGRAGPLEDACQCDLPGVFDDDPALVAEREDLLALVRRLVDELPPTQSEAVVLWSEGFTYGEMAEITGRNEGNLRVLVHRALAWLKQHPALVQTIE